MLQKIMVCSLLLFQGLMAHDSGCSGFYIGEAIGFSNNMSKIRSNSSTEFLLNNVAQVDAEHTTKGDLYKNKLYGELYGGWGCVTCNNFYLGGRFGINFSSFDIKSKGENRSVRPATGTADYILVQDTSVRIKLRTEEYTLDAKLGWTYCQRTLLFGLVGVAFNRPELSIHSAANISLLENTGVQTFQLHAEAKSHKRGDWVNFRW